MITATDAEIRRELKSSLPVTSYVPVNDSERKKIPDSQELKKLRDAGLALLPEFRPRQPRRFPVAIPHHPEIYLLWNEDLPEVHGKPLDRLCRHVVAIGHSASLVQMWVTDNPPAPTMVPVEGIAQQRLRVFGPGKLEYLKARYNRDNVIRYRDALGAMSSLEKGAKDLEMERKTATKGLKGADKKAVEAPFKQKMAEINEAIGQHGMTLQEFDGHIPNSLRPEPGLWQGYAPPASPAAPENPRSFFDEKLIVMTISGKRLDPHSTLKLTETIRGALLSGCPEPIPEWISGHRPDGSRSLDPHLAILPLPFVEHEHADAHLMGVAFALPRQVDPNEAGAILEPWLRDEHGLPRPIKLFDGWLECAMELETRETPPWNLRRENWTRLSRLWTSVTPVVLDRHFDGKDKWEKAAEVVKDACTRIGLPRPEKVLLHPVSLARGVPHSREFPPIKRKSDGGRMHHCHAVILFPEPVLGPVVIGAGRFRGYGLCRPMDQKEIRHE